MAQSEKELERQLTEAGNALLSPPSSEKELLSLLDQVERLLTRVEQSPPESMKKALSPSTKALIADGLVRHSDEDVKVAVASCISEITRITAPDAPYDDDQMKEVFKLIVSSFEKLDDINSPSYIKRTSILETVAKVRSCVVMLDLECDSLIAEMFQHFLRSIREYHPENVFSSMETIMTLVLEESEDVSVDLLSSILDFLKIQDKEVLPIARQLAEKVIENCANKVKPSLLPAVKSRGASVNDFSKVVANICQVGSDAVEPSNGDAGSKNAAERSDLANAPAEKPVEVAMETLDDAPPSEEVGLMIVGSPKSAMSNGNLQKEVEDTSAATEECKEEDRDANEGVKPAVEPDHDANEGVKPSAEPSKPNCESLDAEEQAKPEPKIEKSNKRRGMKTSSSKGSSEPSEPSLADNEEAVKKPEDEERESKDVESAQSKDTVADTAEPADNEKEPDAPISSLKISENETAVVPLPSRSGSLDEIQAEKVGRVKKKDELVQETDPAGEVDLEKESDTKKTTEGPSVSESKSLKRTGKKVSSAAADKDDNITSPETSKKEDEEPPKMDSKPVKQSGKKVETVSSQHEDKKKRGHAKGTPAKDVAKTPSREDAKKPAPKSTAKSSKDESDVEKSSKAGSKRKQSPGGEKASETKGYGADLVGKKVKVWWPADKAYYKGTVDSFDSVKMKHKIVYNDGDVEVLKLAKERWELLEDDSQSDEGHGSDAESPDESAEMPKGKKAKTNTDPGSKRGKTETAKKGGASSSKSKSTPKSKAKDESSKITSKSDDVKAGKSKDLKAGNKSSEEASKSAAKSKDDEAAQRGSNKSKQETPKSAMKSKGKSPNTSTKSNTNGTNKGKAGSSSKEEEAKDAEDSTEPSKAPETPKGKSPTATKSLKGGKKRKRGGKS